MSRFSRTNLPFALLVLLESDRQKHEIQKDRMKSCVCVWGGNVLVHTIHTIHYNVFYSALIIYSLHNKLTYYYMCKHMYKLTSKVVAAELSPLLV